MAEYESHVETPEAQYDLSEVEIVQRIEQLLEERRPAVTDTLVCYELDDANANNRLYTDVARTVEGGVFSESFQNDIDSMEALYGKADREHRSVFLLAIDQEAKRPAGVLRMIRERQEQNSPSALPTFEALQTMFKGVEGAENAARLYRDPREYTTFLRHEYGITNPLRCWDIAIAAVPTEYRASGVAGLVYRAGLKAAKREGVRDFFSIIDRKAYRGMEALGFPFAALPGAQWVPFEGSGESLAVHGYTDEFEPAILAKEQELIRNDRERIAARMAFQVIGAGAHDSAIMS